MKFTWKKEFGELEEKAKSQNENGDKKINLKDLSFLANSPKKILRKAGEVAFLSVL